jgi:hypothetical protein
LEETAALWGPVATAYHWVHTAARILDNEAEESAAKVRHRYQGLMGAMQRWGPLAGELAPAIQHFLKVTRSYGSGLFYCYAIEGLPRTNNDLEHLFGTHRYTERRITGRKTASPTLVIRGPVRIVAAVATRLRTFSATDLAVANTSEWALLRQELDERRHKRILQRRFRRDPEAYLRLLEKQLSS